MPLSAALFDGDGRLLWLSQAASRRFGLHAARLNESLVVTGELSTLESLRRIALADEGELADSMAWTGDLLKEDEEVQRHACLTSTSSDPVVLVSIATRIPPSPMTRDELASLGLSPREADTALLAARGYSNTKIAASLGLRPATAATYLKRAYRKLCVHNKTELSCLLLSRTK